MFASLPAELRDAIACVKLLSGPWKTGEVEKALQECRARGKLTSATLREGVIQVASHTTEHDLMWTNAFGEVAKDSIDEFINCFHLWFDSMRNGRFYRETQFATKDQFTLVSSQ
jgi:hypothetical protein